MGLTQVSTDGVKNDAITKTKIPANQIEASELADNAVDTNAIANDAITRDKIADDVIASEHFIAGEVDTTALATNAVTTAKIADDAVTADKLANSINTAIAANTAKDLTALSASNLTSGTIPDARLPATLPAISGANLTNLPAGGKVHNFIINGAMQVAQRGTSQTGVNSSGYKNVCDRWRFNANGANVGTYTVSQSTDTPDGFGSSLKIDCTTARTPASDELYEVEQRFEGQNLQAFAKGTSAAKKFSVSFYVKTNVSGNYVVWLYDADNNRNIGAVYTVSDSNWNRYTVSFPADTTGAFDNDNARSLDLRFVLLSGTLFTSGTLPTTAWEGTTNANSRAGQTANVASSTSNEWYLTGVQLEVGDSASDFSHESYNEALQKCKRYLHVVASQQYSPIGIGFQYYSATIFIPYGPIDMRTTPTMVAKAGVSGAYLYEKVFSNSPEYHHQIGLDSKTKKDHAMFTMSGDASKAGHAVRISVHAVTLNNNEPFVYLDAEL